MKKDTIRKNIGKRNIGTPEFSHYVSLACLRGQKKPHAVCLEANAQERESLCRRFNLLQLESLTGQLLLSVENSDVLLVEGRMRARCAQACVATLTPVVTEIDQPLCARFSPARSPHLDPHLEGDDDGLFYNGAGPDLGEMLAQELALALPLWPRSPSAPRTCEREEEESSVPSSS